MGKSIWLESLKNAVDSLENSMTETDIPEEIAADVEEAKKSLSAIIEANQ